MLAWALGGPLFGAFSDRMRERKPLYVIGALSALVLWSVIVLAHPSPNVLLALLVAAGFVSGCMVIGFAYAKESVPARLAGTATGVANMGSMTGAMLLQSATEKVWVQHPLHPGTHFSFSLVQSWLRHIADHEVLVERTRPLLFAGFRPQRLRVLVDGVQVAEQEGM